MRGRVAALLLVLLPAAVACQRAEDETAKAIIEHAAAAKGRDAKVTIDRERRSLTVDLGEPGSHPKERSAP